MAIDTTARTERSWPDLPWHDWAETIETLHMWTQIVGKIRLARMPWLNHTWQVTLYPTACGLTTGRMPYGEEAFEIAFDFVRHELDIQTSRGDRGTIQLVPMSVAQFYASLMDALKSIRIPVTIYRRPVEVESRLPFDEDDVHRSYDAEYANRCWHAISSATEILRRFRSRFYGKVSPVHFFWGSFDLAVTRFSGRPAPPHPGGVPNLPDHVTRDAYSHEVSSAGFWPGGAAAPYPLFYSYAYPEPPQLNAASVRPATARYDATLHEFILPYDDVRQSDDPPQALMEFLESTYAAAADLGRWDRHSLEVPEPVLRANIER
jgi:Family of unknown function (DUF5996)